MEFHEIETLSGACGVMATDPPHLDSSVSNQATTWGPGSVGGPPTAEQILTRSISSTRRQTTVGKPPDGAPSDVARSRCAA